MCMCVSVFTFISYPYYKTLSATDNDLMFTKRKKNEKKRIILLFAVLWAELSTRKLSPNLLPVFPLPPCHSCDALGKKEMQKLYPS